MLPIPDWDGRSKWECQENARLVADAHAIIHSESGGVD